MNHNEIYPDEFEEPDFDLPHLPLHWNENLSLEEYLERMERKRNKQHKSSQL
ncbi:hypothetical protein GGR28_001083 [Lewinella aquimaris]|uniref:Uncharacterized protein n=1 Tax=Neolewinella aquimaris TaxID=1835722 RepID=A0A840DZY4_9BACT|nr:hypothetical protein [Neolewinella aquimaris]MBB4078470.1 hypothetical protein [Neolewinella aquimaris]